MDRYAPPSFLKATKVMIILGLNTPSISKIFLYLTKNTLDDAIQDIEGHQGYDWWNQSHKLNDVNNQEVASVRNIMCCYWLLSYFFICYMTEALHQYDDVNYPNWQDMSQSCMLSCNVTITTVFLGLLRLQSLIIQIDRRRPNSVCCHSLVWSIKSWQEVTVIHQDDNVNHTCLKQVSQHSTQVLYCCALLPE